MTFFLWLAGLCVGVLLLIWLGYPAAMWLWARLAADPMRPDHVTGPSRRVSVILATRESAVAWLGQEYQTTTGGS